MRPLTTACFTPRRILRVQAAIRSLTFQARPMQSPQSQLMEPTRSVVIQELNRRIQEDFEPAYAVLCATLLTDDAHSQVAGTLVTTLLERARNGDIDNVVSVAQKASWVTRLLLDRVTQDLDNADHDRTIPSATLEILAEPGATPNLLRLVLRLISKDTQGNILESLLSHALALAQHNDQIIAYSAKDLLFSLLPVVQPSSQQLGQFRKCIAYLLNRETSRTQQTLAYAIWLRLLLSYPSSITIAYVHSPDYWTYLISGFRQGDSERRKLCIELLRQSVAIAVEQNRVDLVSLVHGAAPSLVTSQYARFLTVFETIVLSRHGNLIAEAEKSLQHLVSPQSVLHPCWAYVVFDIALETSTQDQIRRFIGKWILSGSMNTNYPSERFLNFFRETYLPWMTEGHLYTGSLELSSSAIYRCHHGMQVSTLVQQLFQAQKSAESYSALVDTLIIFFLHNRTGIFSYAFVYILDGWIKAIQSSSEGYPLSAEQVHQVLTISDWRSMPDAAKQFIMYCCWRLIEEQKASFGADIDFADNATSQTRYEALEAALRNSTNNTHRSNSLPVSQRDLRMQKAIARCQALQAGIALATPENTTTELDDIWTDAEYLEYPRELMSIVPKTFFCQHVIDLSLNSKDPDGALQALLGRTLDNMLELTVTRSYLLAPLLTEIRRVILLKPAAAEILKLEHLIVSIADSPPEPKKDLRFEYATMSLLHDLKRSTLDTFDLEHPAPHENVGFAAYLDLVSRLGKDQALIASLVDTTVSRWLRQKRPPPTISAFKTSLQLQVLVLCCEQLSLSTNLSRIERLVRDLFELLSIEPLPRYRFLLSWALLGLLARFPSQREKLLEVLANQDQHSNPKYVGALMKLSVDLLHATDITESYAERLAVVFVALSASSKIVIRHESQWSFPILMNIARERSWPSIFENAAHLALDRYIRSLPRFDDPPTERKLSYFDFSTQNHMATLAEGLWTDLDYSRPPYTRREDILARRRLDHSEGLFDIAPSCFDIGSPVMRENPKKTPTQNVDASSLSKSQTMNKEEAVALQTKGSAYLRMLLGGDNDVKARTHKLIVIASLIDNPYNLGGLSRVSEVFGAQALYVRDPRVIAERDFISVAVSSHNHIDILPLAVEDIPDFLTAKRKDGWTVVGVEQTDRSVILGQAADLPEKSILIIGNEKLGMPGKIISECDVLVEIPQIGFTRSMNVQTVAAVALYEYNRQHKTS